MQPRIAGERVSHRADLPGPSLGTPCFLAAPRRGGDGCNAPPPPRRDPRWPLDTNRVREEELMRVRARGVMSPRTCEWLYHFASHWRQARKSAALARAFGTCLVRAL